MPPQNLPLFTGKMNEACENVQMLIRTITELINDSSPHNPLEVMSKSERIMITAEAHGRVEFQVSIGKQKHTAVRHLVDIASENGDEHTHAIWILDVGAVKLEADFFSDIGENEALQIKMELARSSMTNFTTQ